MLVRDAVEYRHSSPSPARSGHIKFWKPEFKPSNCRRQAGGLLLQIEETRKRDESEGLTVPKQEVQS